MKNKTHVVSFRVSSDDLRVLTGMAAAKGLSVGEYARELVFGKLDGDKMALQEIESVHEEVAHLATDMAGFRNDFALAVEALLISSSSGKPISPERARQWVDERLRLPKDVKLASNHEG